MSDGAATGEDGLSLVELIIYVVILGLITTGIAMIFFNLWRAQASVTNETDATARGQLISSQIEKAMRNAIAFEVTNTSLTTGLASGPVLVVATGLPGANACMAFNLSGTTAQLTAVSSGPVSAPPWPTWESGIAPHISGGVTDSLFKRAGNVVQYSFDVTNTSAPTVHFQGTAYMRNPSGTLYPGGGAQTCF